jgi:hypothetical protein
MAYLNLDGYHNEPFSDDDPKGVPPNINWTHGWPWVCLGRISFIPQKGPPPGLPATIMITSRWPFDGAESTYFSIRPFVANMALLTVLVLGTASRVFQLAGQSKFRFRFGLRLLFGLMTITAVVFALDIPSYVNRTMADRIAFAIIVAGFFITLEGLLALILPKRTAGHQSA